MSYRDHIFKDYVCNTILRIMQAILCPFPEAGFYVEPVNLI